MSSTRHPSLIECNAYVEGVSAHKVRTLISAKALPAHGESYTTLCKWPRHTAQGYDDRGEFWWATVTRNADDVFIRPSRKQANTGYAGDDNIGCNILLCFVILVVLWIVTFAVFESRHECLIRAIV